MIFRSDGKFPLHISTRSPSSMNEFLGSSSQKEGNVHFARNQDQKGKVPAQLPPLARGVI
jgi:hypothetical protein